MAEPNRPLLGDLKDEVRRAAGEAAEMGELRWRLARLELTESAAQVKQLAIVLGVAAVMALTALPVLVVWLAATLDGVVFGVAGWLLAFALGLLIVAGVGGWLAYRRFRRQFTGLEETIDELREDLVWLREWAGREDDDEPA